MNDNEFKQKAKRRFLEIYNECSKNYEKYVLRIEELEKSGKIKTEWLKRDGVKSIWDKPNQEDHDEKPNQDEPNPDTKKNLEDHDRQFDITCYSDHKNKNIYFELENEFKR